MTRLTYKVGERTFNTYTAAVTESEETKTPIERVFTEVEEPVNVKPDRYEKVAEHFAEIRARKER